MTEYQFGEFAPDAAKDNANVLTGCLNMKYEADGYRNIRKDRAFDLLGFTGILGAPPAGTYVNSVASRNVGWAVPPDGETIISVFQDAPFSYNVYRKQRFSGESGTPGITYILEYTTSQYIKHSLINFGNTAMLARGNAGKAVRRDHSNGSWSAVAGMVYNSHGLYNVRDFVFSIFPNVGQGCAIEWSDINNPTTWGGTGLSDFQVFPTGGGGMCVVPTDARADVGGESLYVFQRNAIRRGTFVGDSTFVFSFDLVTDQLGCLNPLAAAQLKGDVYFIADDGLYKIQNRTIVPIGDGRVNNYFFSKSQGLYGTSASQDFGCVVTADPVLGEVLFLGRGTNTEGAALDVCLIYNPDKNMWRERNGSFDKLNELTAVSTQSFIGNALNGELERGTNPVDYACLATSPLRSKLGGRVMVNSVYPRVNGDPARAFLRYATTCKIGDTRTYSTQRTLNSANKFPIRASGKDISIKLEFTSSDASPNPVTGCSGIDLDVVQIGQR
jgi:hypothetical protein